MPSVAKARFYRDAYLRNDTNPETLDKIKSLINDTKVMPQLHIPVSDWAKGALILLGEMECEEGESSYPLNYVMELYEAYMEEYKNGRLELQECLIHCQKTYYLFLFNVKIVVLHFTFLLIQHNSRSIINLQKILTQKGL